MSEARTKCRELLFDDRVQQLLDEDFAHCLNWRGGLPYGLHRVVHRWLVEREMDATCCGTLLRFAHAPDKFHFAMMWKGASAAELIVPDT